jgi:hypothetical protein
MAWFTKLKPAHSVLSIETIALERTTQLKVIENITNVKYNSFNEGGDYLGVCVKRFGTTDT